MGLQRIDLEDECMDQTGMGIQVERFDQERKEGRDLPMRQPKEACADQEQQQAFHHFERCDDGQTAMVRFPHYQVGNRNV